MCLKTAALSPSQQPLWRLVVLYGLLTVGCVLGFLLIRHFGERLPKEQSSSAATGAPNAPAAEAKPAPKADVLPRLLLVLAAVIVTGRVLAAVLASVHQPPVIGEVLAGIVLGPSLLGWVSEAWFGGSATPLLTPEVAPALSVIAQLGVILYMFLVGLEFNPGMLRSQVHAAVAISHASIVAPFMLGSLLALAIFTRLAPEGTTFTSFALFMGVALAVTAFPVLARILTDRQMAQTELGVLALSCAAVDDATAWCLLALVAGVARSQASGVVNVFGFTLLFVLVMLLAVRPIAARLIALTHGKPLGPTTVAIVFAALLMSALTTEWIGIHAVFGAFVLGVIVPHESQIALSLKQGLEQVVTVLLLPAFFAYTGMRMQIGLISGWENWLICLAIIALASLGKFGGTLAAARLTGLDWKTSSALGILMNTRGLMELIVLNVGMDLGVISPTLFAMMVVMALTTTLATTPLLVLCGQKPVPEVANVPAAH